MEREFRKNYRRNRQMEGFEKTLIKNESDRKFGGPERKRSANSKLEEPCLVRVPTGIQVAGRGSSGDHWGVFM